MFNLFSTFACILKEVGVLTTGLPWNTILRSSEHQLPAVAETLSE